MRIVVCTIGGRHTPWDLPASVFLDRTWIGGGERSLYELAVAAAETGADVELRGDLMRRPLDEIARAAGAAPKVGMGPRPPAEDDLIVVPEGWTDPAAYARVALTPSRKVLLLLAPSGLFGWPFVAGWSPPDPLTVAANEVSRPEHYRGMAALGFELWTNTARIAEEARDAGVECRDIGMGTPLGFEEREKLYDVAAIGGNRWAPLAEGVFEELGDGGHILIPEVEHARLLELLGSSRILLWPSRIEGQARIQTEARAMGVVPVALSTNRYGIGLSEAEGTVVVNEVGEMATAVKELLADPPRLDALSRAGIDHARQQMDWGSYRTRVAEALEAPGVAPDAGWEARAEMGAAIGRVFDQVRGEADARMASAEQAFDRFRKRRAVRVAARLADLTRPLRRGRGPEDAS